MARRELFIIAQDILVQQAAYVPVCFLQLTVVLAAEVGRAVVERSPFGAQHVGPDAGAEFEAVHDVERNGGGTKQAVEVVAVVALLRFGQGVGIKPLVVAGVVIIAVRVVNRHGWVEAEGRDDNTPRTAPVGGDVAVARPVIRPAVAQRSPAIQEIIVEVEPETVTLEKRIRDHIPCSPRSYPPRRSAWTCCRP